MPNKTILAFLIALFSFSLQTWAQQAKVKRFRIMSYNVENLYDPFNDSLTADEEFLPTGIRRWTYTRMLDKIKNIAKVVIAAGEWKTPEIIGLCEIENKFVLVKLLTETPLKNFDYGIVHYNSPDKRGIDVALLYKKDDFNLLKTCPLKVVFPNDSVSTTRDILYVKGFVKQAKDTLHVFVNHWPSKYGGELETMQKREAAALILKNKTDSVFTANPNANIVIMGDFNDAPTEKSIEKILGASLDTTTNPNTLLYNMYGTLNYKNKGTIKFRNLWQCIDHLIVSKKMLNDKNKLHIVAQSFRIFDQPFLLQKDEAWFGEKPFRTFYGAKYQAGFSDHLPLIVDLTWE